MSGVQWVSGKGQQVSVLQCGCLHKGVGALPGSD